LGSRRGCPATSGASPEGERSAALGTPGAVRPPLIPRRSGLNWSMRRLIVLLAAGGSVRLWGCRRIGGSAMR
jgi:hypothetical protein